MDKDITPDDIELSNEDLRAALTEMNSFIDVTEEDLRKIYTLALRHAKERLASNLPVKEVMTGKVITVNRNAWLCEVTKILSDSGVSGLPVVDENNLVIGVVTEADVLSLTGVRKGHTLRDILLHLFGEPLPERKPGNRVEDIMSSPAITIAPAASIREAARTMEERKVKRLPVVDSEGRLKGIISRADIVKAMSRR